MNVLAAALLTLGIGQPPGDYFPVTSRSAKMSIAYTPEERKNIQQVELWCSRDNGQTYQLEATAGPEKDSFTFLAKEDGVYWFHMVVVFKDKTRDPVDVTKAPNPQKLLVDTAPPTVRVVNAARTGDEVAVDWTVDDKYPAPSKTKLAYRPAGGSDQDWKDVPLTGPDPRTARFNPGTPAAIQVRVTGEDLAGNTTPVVRDIAGTSTSGFMAPVDSGKAAPQPAAPPGPGPLAPPTLAPVTPVTPVAADPPPAAPPGPPAPVVNLTPAAPTPVTPAPMVVPAAAPPAAAPPAAAPPAATPPALNPTVTATTEPPAAPMPLAVGSGVLQPTNPTTVAASAPPTPAPAELPPIQAINFTRFDLPYQVEAGPSGVKVIDLYVTRDDGRTWAKWSQHDGKESPLKVNLQPRFDVRPDGRYGFKLVPVSGAGLSEEPPRPGTPPDYRVLVDTVPPLIKIYRPEPDTANRNILNLIWSVTEENPAKDPISLEWSESATGPWRSVVGNDSVVAAGGNGQTLPRIANTGRYAWALPATLPTHLVYLKVTAWDAAGNKSELATPEPVLVDLMKPRAKIQAIQATLSKP